MEELFDLNDEWTISPMSVTEVAGCKNCTKVGGISILIKDYLEKEQVELTVICKLCGLEDFLIAENAEEAKIMLLENIDLWDEEE
jgi:hypothetical protein